MEMFMLKRRIQELKLPNMYNFLFSRPSLTCPTNNSRNPSPHSSTKPPKQVKPTQSFADRILRALRHHLRLLHRSGTDFYILGATGNVYTVTLATTSSCTCPDRTTPCKHMLFVFIRVLGLSLDDMCIRRRTIRPCQVNRLLSTPTSVDTLAGTRVRERFHQMFERLTTGAGVCMIKVEDDAMCPICMDEMRKEDKVVACGECKNPLHEECLMTWKRTRGRRSANCVICRARWKDRREQDKYLNLAEYVSDDDMAESGCID